MRRWRGGGFGRIGYDDRSQQTQCRAQIPCQIPRRDLVRRYRHMSLPGHAGVKQQCRRILLATMAGIGPIAVRQVVDGATAIAALGSALLLRQLTTYYGHERIRCNPVAPSNGIARSLALW